MFYELKFRFPYDDDTVFVLHTYYELSDHKCTQCNSMTLICFCKPLPSCKQNFSNQAHAMVF